MREEHGELSAPPDLFTASGSRSVPAALKSERSLRDTTFFCPFSPQLCSPGGVFLRTSLRRCQLQRPTSPGRPPCVCIGLRSLLRWWNFLGFPAWKRSIQLISGYRELHLTGPRATQPVTRAPQHPHRPESAAALCAPPPLDSVPEGLGAPFGVWLRR